MDKLNSKVIDYVLLAINTLFTIFMGYSLLIATTLPTKWRIIGFVIFLVIYLIIVILTIYKWQNTKMWIRRIFIIIITIVLALGSLYLGKVKNAINDIADDKGGNYINISVIALNDSSIDSIDDLKGKTVGIQNGLDKDNANYVKKKLNKEVSNIKYEEGESYIALADSLNNKSIDALIITDSYINNINDSNEQFAGSIKKIKTYKKTVDNNTNADTNKDLTKHPFTVLLSGVDTSDDGEASQRSDVNMILMVNPLTNHVEMASIPRDSYIPNLALGSGNDKLTHTGNDGIDNTISSIENIIGFEIDYYVQVNFTSVVKIVDAIGGITVNVPVGFTEQNSERSFADSDLITLEAGEQELNGEQTLALARHRHSYTDLQRTEAQQLIVQALVNKLMSSKGVSAVPSLLDILPKYIKTNASSDQLNNFINYQLDHIDKWTFSSVSLENGTSDMLPTASMGSMPLSCYILNKSDLQNLWNRYQIVMHPTTFAKFKWDKNNKYEGITTYSAPSGAVFVGDSISTSTSTDYNTNSYSNSYDNTTQYYEAPTTDTTDTTITSEPSLDTTTPDDSTQQVEPTNP